MTIDIIILSLTNSVELFETTKECIRSLRKSEDDHNFNIIVAESNKNFRDDYSYDDCEVIIPEGEFNYNRFCNIGLEHCSSEWVALCNNDLIFQKNWFSEIFAASQELKDVQSFSPWNSYNNWHNERFKEIKPYYEGYGIGYELTGWCIVAKREIFQKVKLDDRVSFWFSDDVYRDELQKHGIKHALVRSSVVAHITSKTLLSMPADVISELTEKQMANYTGGCDE